jgi:CDGSH-type Zn-finger protein
MSITIIVRNNGPYRISVEDAPLVRIEDAAGNVIEPTEGKPISLRRCGASLKKPLCDGTHKQFCFEEAPRAAAPPEAALGAAGVTTGSPPTGGTPG